MAITECDCSLEEIFSHFVPIVKISRENFFLTDVVHAEHIYDNTHKNVAVELTKRIFNKIRRSHCRKKFDHL